jgi:DNA-binding SARP family transcriptional activator/urease gamma subunit
MKQQRETASEVGNEGVSTHFLYPAIRIYTCGEFALERLIPSSVSPVDLPQYKPVPRGEWSHRGPAITMLKVLLCSDDRRASRDMLIEEIWPGKRGSAINTDHALHSAASVLRTILRTAGGKSLLLNTSGSDGSGYKLADQQQLWTDMDAFESYISEAVEAVRLGHDALPLWEAAYQLAQRPFLPDDLYSSWSQERREILKGNRRLCVYRLAVLYSERDRKDEAEVLLRGLWAANPTNEDALCRLMVLLEEQARDQEALLLYERTERALDEERRRPAQQTKELAERIRNRPLSLATGTPLSVHEQGLEKRAREKLVSQENQLTLNHLPTQGHTSVTQVSSFQSLLPGIHLSLSGVQAQQNLLSLSSHTPTSTTSEQTLIEKVISPEQMLLIDEKEDSIAKETIILYDSFEVDVVVTTLNSGFRHESLSALQKSIQEKIRDYDTMAEHFASDSTRLSRRQALRVIMKLPIQVYALALFGGGSKPVVLAEEALPLFAAGLTACKALLQDGEIDTISHVLSTYLPTLETKALQPSAHQGSAAHLVSQGYLLATIIADHRRKLDHMEAFSRAARRYAQLANDPNLEVSALARLAVKYDYERSDRRALLTYQEALALPTIERVSPLLRGRLYAGLAGTNAYCFQRNEALNFLALAKDTYPARPEEDPCFHFAYCGYDTLFLWEGLTRKHLGQYTEAWNAFSTLGKLQPQPGLHDRNRAEFLNYLASVAVKQRALDTSCLYIEAAEEIAWNIKHEQRYAEVLETYRNIQTLWPHEPAVRKLQAKLSARQVV